MFKYYLIHFFLLFPILVWLVMIGGEMSIEGFSSDHSRRPITVISFLDVYICNGNKYTIYS